MIRIFMLCAGLLFVGCATNFQAPPLSADHPASPQAAEARRGRPARLVADQITQKTKAQLARKAAPDADYHPTDAGTQPDMGNMKGTEGMPGMGDTKSTPTAKSSPEAKSYWTCVMHPEIHSDKPGQCPKCGMTLVKKEGAPE